MTIDELTVLMRAIESVCEEAGEPLSDRQMFAIALELGSLYGEPE